MRTTCTACSPPAHRSPIRERWFPSSLPPKEPAEMAFGGFPQGGAPAPLAKINMIPLIDVMLVLLVIFIITAPLLTHAVKLDLPQASSRPNFTKPEHIG